MAPGGGGPGGGAQVKLDYEDRIKISEICSELDVDGLRGDMVTNRAAKALAAFEGRTQVPTRQVLEGPPCITDFLPLARPGLP